ncbi:MAG: hypothetical protein RIS47_390 [Bacteroidota bacterium]
MGYETEEHNAEYAFVGYDHGGYEAEIEAVAYLVKHGVGVVHRFGSEPDSGEGNE